MNRRSGLTLVEIAVVIVLVIIIAVLAFPVFHHTHGISGNETSAVGMLRTLVTQENMWHKQDADGNGINDYWAADVSGLYRVLRQPVNTEAMMIDISVARADWAPLGGFPPPAMVGAPGLAAMNHAVPIPNGCYYVAAFVLDADRKPYATDNDGKGQVYENTSRFAFMAFPAEYNRTGINVFIVDASGVIWRIDAVSGGYNLSTGEVDARPGLPPITKWPHADPASAGYYQAE